jgi:hypothetical protein
MMVPDIGSGDCLRIMLSPSRPCLHGPHSASPSEVCRFPCMRFLLLSTDLFDPGPTRQPGCGTIRMLAIRSTWVRGRREP